MSGGGTAGGARSGGSWQGGASRSGSWHGSHGGHHHRHFHGSTVFFGSSFFWSPWWYAPWPYYPPYYSTVVTEPPVYIQGPTGPTVPSFWYYCQSAQGYYPNVQSCPEDWIRVPPRSP